MPDFMVQPVGNKERTLGGVGSGSTEADAIADYHKTRGYRSTHYDEPNILAHVRFNERTDADGKRVLFIEEVQSDWMQQKRKDEKALLAAIDKDWKSGVTLMKKDLELRVLCP